MKVFISAVSAQFKDCRNALASDLRAIGCEVKVQEDFQGSPATLIGLIEAYVAQCDRVIAIVGDAYGTEANTAGAASAPPRRSYTQWEYYLALGERVNGPSAPPKEMYLYFASEEYLRDHPAAQPAEYARRQQAFCQEVKDSGKYRGEFDTAHQLCRLVLRDGWQMRERPAKPRNLPEPLGSIFKGREDYLRNIREGFLSAHSIKAGGPFLTAIHGQAGVGKTRLAVEYGWRHRGDYTALLFVPANSPDSLRRNLANLAGPFVLNLSAARDRPEEDQMAQALAWLRDHPGWFLILDNVDTEEAAKAVLDILPQLLDGDVLVTSRLRNWRPGVFEKLELDVLKPDDARALFLDLLGTAARERVPGLAAEVDPLLRDLDGLAVSIEHAAAYIACVGCSVTEFRRRLGARDTHVREWHDPALLGYPRSVATMYDTTFEWLKNSPP